MLLIAYESVIYPPSSNVEVYTPPYTHMLNVSHISVDSQAYTQTFYSVNALRHMSTYYTHMFHISSDMGTTPVYMKPETHASIRGLRSVLTMHLGHR